MLPAASVALAARYCGTAVIGTEIDQRPPANAVGAPFSVKDANAVVASVTVPDTVQVPKGNALFETVPLIAVVTISGSVLSTVTVSV